MCVWRWGGGGDVGGDGGARVPVVAAQWTSRETGRLEPVVIKRLQIDFPWHE